MLTVEDANTIIRKYGVESFFYEFDTTCLPFPEDKDFTDYECEFFSITKELVNGVWEWTFIISNTYYTAQAGLSKREPNTGFEVRADKIIVQGNNFILLLEISVLGNHPATILNHVLLDGIPNSIPLNRVGKTVTTRWQSLRDSTIITSIIRIYLGINIIRPTTMAARQNYLVRLLKTQFRYNCNQTLTCGKINKVLLGTNTDYKPGGALIQDNTPNITVEYKNQIIPVTWSETDNDYIFYLDLTQDYNPGKLNLNILVGTNDVINESIDSVTLYKEVMEVDNFDALRVEISEGTGLIRLTDTILFGRDLTIANDVKIIGNNKKLELEVHHIHLEEGKTLILNDATVQWGAPAIIQEPNTTLELNRCTFKNNLNQYNNNLGACVYCNTDVEGLTVTDDYITRITDCIFTNNHSAIFHGGQLSITGSKFIIQYTDFMKANNPAFLYQTDGEANITNSSFIIIQDNEEWCINEKNIGYAQCILICGESAIVNGADHSTLQKQNSLPFYDTYNNKTYLYAKYYYPRLERCVVTSPLPGFEDKNCTYAVSGVDWVFKQNSQVTLPNQANNNQPNWEEW